MSKRQLFINTAIIAVALLVVSFLVYDPMPFVLGAGALNMLNIVAFITSNNKNQK